MRIILINILIVRKEFFIELPHMSKNIILARKKKQKRKERKISIYYSSDGIVLNLCLVFNKY